MSIGEGAMPVPEVVRRAREKYFAAKDAAWVEYHKTPLYATERERKNAENVRIATIRKAYIEYCEVMDKSMGRP